MGAPDSQRESEIKPKEWPKHMPKKVYRNRTQCLLDRLEDGQDNTSGIVTEDKIL